jgi:hypothetical protein
LKMEYILQGPIKTLVYMSDERGVVGGRDQCRLDSDLG